ncbi:hypothetical protein FA13DRAFT_1727879 [Coprinellus micaceus]|uniref:Uncharacterized protein n=1 Tax=Coprinellus micaceus TaxID=71717 RepID=A0A4Y7TQQ5_COPMI|nr:hypothetical protein FA13DRAFT_1727879 [Coprinellus micaceus]
MERVQRPYHGCLSTLAIYRNIHPFLMVEYPHRLHLGSHYLSSELAPRDPSLLFRSFVKTCIARSGSHPLDIDIRDIPAYGELTYLTETSDRWEKLTIPCHELPRVMKSEAFKGFPQLRNLDLSYDARTFKSTSNPPPVQMALDLPHLITLRLSVPQIVTRLSAPDVTDIHLSLRVRSAGSPRMNFPRERCLIGHFGPSDLPVS